MNAPQNIPSKPGVYLFKDVRGNVLYVGKASSLKNRLRSYFPSRAPVSPRQKFLMEQAEDVEFVVTDSETEALILENHFIKKHKPRFNVRLRDDKTYPYIRISMQENFPKLSVVRRMEKDGARYFGPYTSSGSMWDAIRLIQRLFPIATCNITITGSEPRACLEYQIKRCVAPCIERVSREEYRNLVQQACHFLEGKEEQVLKNLKNQMQKASRELQFEDAAAFRDRLRAVQRVMEKQKMVLHDFKDRDVFGIFMSSDGSLSCVYIFFIRSGRLLSQEHVVVETGGAEKEEVLSSCMKQFYEKAAQAPDEVCLPFSIKDAEAVSGWLQKKCARRVHLLVPQRGAKRNLVRLASENAKTVLSRMKQSEEQEKAKRERMLFGLQEALRLTKPPSHIECFDISNIAGALPVGSLVVFKDGRPEKKEYRKFHIKTVEGIDDFKMLEEVVFRRYSRMLREETNLPDLVVLDGGKGQLSAARNAFEQLGLHKLPSVGLAKENEDVYTSPRGEPLVLSKDSPALHLLQQLRDEAHRFAVTFHRSLRGKKISRSLLEQIPGIGIVKRKRLLSIFGSLKNVQNATTRQLKEAGLHEKTVSILKQHLSSHGF